MTDRNNEENGVKVAIRTSPPGESGPMIVFYDVPLEMAYNMQREYNNINSQLRKDMMELAQEQNLELHGIYVGEEILATLSPESDFTL